MKSDGELADRQLAYGLHFDALVLHCPSPVRSPSSRVHADWEAACQQFLADRRVAGEYSDLDELTFVTINTHGQTGLLERCFHHIGLRDLAVLGRGVRDWRWSYKITLLHDWLMTSECTTPYLAYLDGDDVLLIGDPRDMLRRFQETGSDLLFCNTRFDWPLSEECRTFEAEAYGIYGRHHQHLNAGGWIGSTAYISRLVGDIAAAIDRDEAWCRTRNGFDDQLAWRQLHRREYPRMRVDAECRVFIRFDNVR